MAGGEGERERKRERYRFRETERQTYILTASMAAVAELGPTEVRSQNSICQIDGQGPSTGTILNSLPRSVSR